MRLRLVTGVVLALVLTSACGSRLPDDVLARIDAGDVGGTASGESAAPGTDAGSNGTGSNGAPLAPGSPQGVPGDPTATTIAGGGPTDTSGAAPGTPADPAAACTTNGGATDVGVTADEIKVASIVTESGPLPGATAGGYRGAAAYFAMINAQGGVCGRRITLVKGDDGLDPARARSEFLRLEPDVFAFTAPFGVADAGVIDLVQSTNVPWIGTFVDPAGRGLPSVYPKVADGIIHTGPFAYLHQTHPDAVNAAILYPAVAGVRVNVPGFEAAIQQAGFNLVYVAEANPVAPDYTAHVVNMRDAGVQFLYLFAFEVNMHSRFIRNMDQQRWDPEIKLGNINYNTRFFELVGDLGNGWMSHMAFLPVLDEAEAAASEAVGRFFEWNQRLFPRDQVDLFPVTGWGDAELFVQALRIVGPNLTRQALIDALATITATDNGGLEGAINPSTGEGSPCFVLVRGEGGTWVRDHPTPSGFECGVGEFHRFR